MAPNDRVRRRAFLGTVGAACVALAGCSGGGDPSDGTDTPANDGADTTTSTATPSGTDGTETATPTETGAYPERPDWMPSEGELYDDFSAFDEDWEVVGGSATLLEEESFMGTPAVRMANDGDDRARIERRYWQPVDLSSVDFSMAVKLEETTRSSPSFSVVLWDIDGNTRTLTDEIPQEVAGEWVRLDPGATSTDDVDTSQITRVRINHWGGDEETTFLVSDVRTHPKPERGTVVFALEDQAVNNVERAYPALSDAGFAGGVFLSPDHVSESTTPSVADYREMRDDGWDIGVSPPGHGRPSELDDERAAVEDAVSQLEEKGLDGATTVFRPTHGDYTPATLDYAAEMFDLTFVGRGASLGTTANLTDTRTVMGVHANNLERARECVDAAARFRQTAVLFFHTRHVDDWEAFQSLVDRTSELAENGDVDVVTPTELAERYA